MTSRVQRTIDQLSSASSDEERWRIVLAGIHAAMRVFPELKRVGAQEWVKSEILVPTTNSYVWLKGYPNIVRQLDLEVSDLQSLGKKLEEREHLNWEETAGQWNVWIASDMSRGEIAREWLRLLVGREFDEESEFATWLEKNRDSLVWDKALGRFEAKPTSDRANAQTDREGESKR